MLLSLAVSVINVASVRFLPDFTAAGVVTLVNFIAGGNMIFDLINRSAWQRKVQDQAEQISNQRQEIYTRDRQFLDKDRELLDKDRGIHDRDREIRDQGRAIEDRDREIAELRRQVAEGGNGKDAD